jgi:hypothetical protein
MHNMATVNVSDGIPSIPEPPTGTVEEVAAWYAQHAETLKAVSSAKYIVERRLRAYYRDHGPIVTAFGTVTEIPDGYDIDADAVAALNPALISSARVTMEGSVEDILRAVSLVEEECPAIERDPIAMTVDRTEVTRLIRAKGAMAAKLDACRKPKGRLGVTT